MVLDLCQGRHPNLTNRRDHLGSYRRHVVVRCKHICRECRAPAQYPTRYCGLCGGFVPNKEGF